MVMGGLIRPMIAKDFPPAKDLQLIGCRSFMIMAGEGTTGRRGKRSPATGVLSRPFRRFSFAHGATPAAKRT